MVLLARERRQGFTLLELLVVMAIMAVILSLAVAAFRDMGRGAGMRGGVMQFKSTLSLARTTAITKRSVSGVVYGNQPDGRAFYYVTNANDGVIGTKTRLPNGIMFRHPTYGLNEFTNSVSFKITGVGLGMGISNSVITISEAVTNGMQAVLIINSMTGRVRTQKSGT